MIIRMVQEKLWIIFALHSIQISCGNISCIGITKSPLIQGFGYDFQKVPKIGEVLIWKMASNRRGPKAVICTREMAIFGPNETYILFTQKFQGYFVIYYWMGRNTSLADKKTVAQFAIKLNSYFFKLHLASVRELSVSREIDNLESDSFTHTRNLLVGKAGKYTDIQKYIDSELPAQFPNLYVTRGTDLTSRIKKVPIGIQFLKRDSCLILEMGLNGGGPLGPVNIFCGLFTHAEIRTRAMLLNIVILYYYNDNGMEHLQFMGHRSTKFKVLLEILEDSTYSKTNEIDDSIDHLLDPVDFISARDEAVSLFQITNKSVLKSVTQRPIRLSDFLNFDCKGYILDTKSVAGVFLVLTDTRNLNARMGAIRKAEEYLFAKDPSSKQIPLTIVDIFTHHPNIDFRINTVEWPSVYLQDGNTNVFW